MPQFAFYMAGASLGGGMLGLILAWDPLDEGMAGADDPLSSIALYTWVGPLLGDARFMKIKSRQPVTVPAGGCPVALDGGTDHDYFVRFGMKAGGVGATSIVDGWLEVFEESTRVYGIAPAGETRKVELADGSFASSDESSFQDRLTYQALDDPPEGDFWTGILGHGVDSREIWRELMTPNLPVRWSPF
jgi:hypothetical protein